MKKYKIAVLVGSLRKESWNRQLARVLMGMMPEEFECEFVEIGDLPLYNQDDDYTPAEPVARLRAQIKAADGVLLISPEYNRSLSGVLKNALDHGSRPWGESVWRDKPAGVIGVAGGAIGTAVAQQHMRTIMAALNMPTMGHPEAFLQYQEDLFYDDNTPGERSKDFLQNWVDSYVRWIKLHNSELV